MDIFIITIIFITPGVVFLLNVLSIESILWKNLDMKELKRSNWRFLNPCHLPLFLIFGYGWILSKTVRHLVIRSILEQTKSKLEHDFETRSRLRDVGLILYDKFG